MGGQSEGQSGPQTVTALIQRVEHDWSTLDESQKMAYLRTLVLELAAAHGELALRLPRVG